MLKTLLVVVMVLIIPHFHHSPTTMTRQHPSMEHVLPLQNGIQAGPANTSWQKSITTATVDHIKSTPSSVPCPVSGGKGEREPWGAPARTALPAEQAAELRHLLEPRNSPAAELGPQPTLPLLGCSWLLLVPENNTITGMLPQQQGWMSPGRSRASPPAWRHRTSPPQKLWQWWAPVAAHET